MLDVGNQQVQFLVVLEQWINNNVEICLYICKAIKSYSAHVQRLMNVVGQYVPMKKLKEKRKILKTKTF